MSKNVAVILSGCGFLDGAEIRESVLTLLALDSENANVKIFAPNQDQHHVINHHGANEVDKKRNILEESARIARGEISDISDLNEKEFDALILPGGYGVAKNLCDFAFKGSQGQVNELTKKAVLDFHKASKPIGAICIAPALMALVLGEKGVSVTIGTDKDTASEIEKTGARHFNCEVNEIHIDVSNKVVTTPAYMFGDARVSKVSEGIHACVKKVIELA